MQLNWLGVSTEKNTANLGTWPIEKADEKDEEILLLDLLENCVERMERTLAARPAAAISSSPRLPRCT
jgi:hypothetical protein